MVFIPTGATAAELESLIRDTEALLNSREQKLRYLELGLQAKEARLKDMERRIVERERMGMAQPQTSNGSRVDDGMAPIRVHRAPKSPRSVEAEPLSGQKGLKRSGKGCRTRRGGPMSVPPSPEKKRRSGPTLHTDTSGAQSVADAQETQEVGIAFLPSSNYCN